MAYLQRIDGIWGLPRFHLRCSCGFQTEAAPVGFMAEACRGGRDSWSVAWYDAKARRLRHEVFAVSLDAVLHREAERWRDEEVVPHIRKLYGNCFVSIPDEAVETDLPCPGCCVRNLIQEPVA